MARRRGIVIGGVLLVAALVGAIYARDRPVPRLLAVGPLQISNRRATPLTLWGEHLPRDARVVLTPGPTLAAADQDDAHLGVVVPPLTIAPETVRARVSVRVEDGAGRPIAGEATLDVVNDAAFRDPIALALATTTTAARWAAVSPTTGELFERDVAEPRRLDGGPRAIAAWGERWVVVLEDAGALQIVGDPRPIPLGGRPMHVVVDAPHATAWVSDRATDAVIEVDLRAGAVRRRVPVPPKPEVLALADDTLWISSAGAETIAALDLHTATATPTIVRMGPGAPIIGGPTEKYARYVMGGKPARAFAAAPSLGVIFAATIGPNIGPNPDRMEVSMNGGVTVIDAKTRRFVRHVALDQGVPQGLAWDEKQQRLYVADVGGGRIVVLDGAKLAAPDDATARAAQLAAFALPVPAGLPRIRPASDLAPTKADRAGESLHVGPWDLALAPTGELVVLTRFARTVDVLRATDGALLSRTALDDRTAQETRRRGQIVYFTDVGHSRMSCDTCHPEGQDGGLLFTKGQPMQIHRSISILSAHDSAPYFTPARLPTLAVMAHVVLTRNRYENPQASPAEAAALTEYVRAFSARPSPLRPDARLPDAVALPGGRAGSPQRGRVLFEGRAGCADAKCHPPPHFTADQTPTTRGQFADVGTPRRLALREAMQDPAPPLLPPPSLLGLWDSYPLLFSGAGGFRVDGERVVATEGLAVERALALHRHAPLTDAELADVVAYLLTL